MRVTIAKGQTLYQALEQNNIILDRPCNGRGTCGGCAVEVDRIGRVKSCQFRLPGTYEVKLKNTIQFHTVMAQEEILPGEEALRKQNTISIAIDIGTTTVALMAYGYGKKCVRSFVNPQRKMGADVMSRIQMANEGHADELRELIMKRLLESMEELVDEILAPQTEVTDSEPVVCRAAIAANTTMGHILCGFSCEGLAAAPFSPVSLDLQRLHWEFGTERRIQCEAMVLPGISAFVGGDIVSGLYTLDFVKKREPALLLDLGTNGEMALWTGSKLLVTSAAAGPAFEASDVAVYVHAAGIMKVLRECLAAHIIDEHGTLQPPYFEKGYPVVVNEEGGREEIAFLTQDDIRDIQMAKGAIRAGIEILLCRAGMEIGQIRHIYLAGGMGYYIDTTDAGIVGLLPREYQGQMEAVGNSALKGAVRFLSELEQAEPEMSRIRELAREIVLADDADFMERYVEYMNF